MQRQRVGGAEFDLFVQRSVTNRFTPFFVNVREIVEANETRVNDLNRLVAENVAKRWVSRAPKLPARSEQAFGRKATPLEEGIARACQTWSGGEGKPAFSR